MRAGTLGLFAAALLSMCSLGRADFRYTESGELTGMDVTASIAKYGYVGPRTTVTATSVQGACLRIDLADGTYGIVDLEGRREFQVNPKNQTYFVITLDEIRVLNQAQEQQNRQFQQKNGPARFTTRAELAWTGRTRVFLGQTARELRIRLIDHQVNGREAEPQDTSLEVESWIAPKVTGFAEIRSFYAKLTAAINGQPPDPIMRGVVQLQTAQWDQEGERPVWVPLLTRGILDTCKSDGFPSGLPMLQTYGTRPRTPQRQAAVKGNGQRQAAPHGVATGNSARVSSTNRAFRWALTVHVTAYSGKTLNRSLFQVPSNYVKTQSNPKNMWILDMGQW